MASAGYSALPQALLGSEALVAPVAGNSRGWPQVSHWREWLQCCRLGMGGNLFAESLVTGMGLLGHGAICRGNCEGRSTIEVPLGKLLTSCLPEPWEHTMSSDKNPTDLILYFLVTSPSFPSHQSPVIITVSSLSREAEVGIWVFRGPLLDGSRLPVFLVPNVFFIVFSRYSSHNSKS